MLFFVIFIYIHLFTVWVDIGVLIHLFIHEIVCDILYYVWCANKLNSIQFSRVYSLYKEKENRNDSHFVIFMLRAVSKRDSLLCNST